MDALQQGDKAHAKDILTRLLKTDQNNATYWVWMSAAVDTPKERIYCLQTALKLDPENGIAKRGLILFGALTPDENVQPFPLNRPRAWDENLLLEHEQPKEKGLHMTLSNPMTRLAGIVLLGVLVCGASVFAMLNPRTNTFIFPATNTPGASPTFTLTPTFVNATGLAPSTQTGPTPLAVLFGVSYTPTPLYVNTPRSPLSQDIYNAAKAAYQQGNWDEYIREMEQVQNAEPDAADVPYYIGEAYRFQGKCRQALEQYNNALKIDDNFAPAYLGLARARICIDPGADTTQLYDLAIQADPAYSEVYLDRANYNLVRRDFKAALPDLEKAEKLMPNSALVQLAFARAYLLQGDDVKALTAAQKANSIDLTLLPSYYYLGAAEVANEQYQNAVQPLETYLIYEKKDGSAYALLGEAYTKIGDYQSAVDALGQAVKLDPNQVQSYTYLGTSELQLGNLDDAEKNFQKALHFFPDSFEANIGLTQVYYKRETFGSAYLQAETSKAKATDDSELALAIYWRGLSQVGRGSFGDAIKDFQTVLSMPDSVTTPEMRKTADEQLKSLITPTRTPRVTQTSTPRPSGSKTPGPTKTPLPTKKP